jgi:hypothetical protein
MHNCEGTNLLLRADTLMKGLFKHTPTAQVHTAYLFRVSAVEESCNVVFVGTLSFVVWICVLKVIAALSLQR